MSASRALLLAISCGIGLFITGSLGAAQPAIATGFRLIPHVGLPAVDVGQLKWQFRGPARTASSRAAHVPGRVIVKFRDGSSMASRALVAQSASRTATISRRPAYANFDIVNIAPSEDAEAFARALEARGDVEYAQADYVIHKRLVPNDPLYAELQWNLPMVELERAWDIQPQAGSSITVAVLDSGVAYTDATIHLNIPEFSNNGFDYPALSDVIIPYSAAPQLGPLSRFVSPFDFVWNSSMPLDFDGHGTHVTGTVGQLTNDGVGVAGVAFNVKIMPVKVICGMWDTLFGIPDSQCGSDSQLAQAIRYAADNGAKVINMSIGRSGESAPAVEDAMRYAVGKGAFLAVAAGNAGAEGNPVEVLAEIAGRLDGAVAVAAVDVGRNQAPYSSFGPFVELSAPGGGGGNFDQGYVWQQTFDFRVVETFNEPVDQYGPPRFDVHAYVGYAGTSMAAPHVSGVAAMIMQQGITNPAAVEAALERTAVDLGGPGRDILFGFGLLDARSALRGLGLAR